MHESLRFSTIYGLTDPRRGDVRYVGQTVQTPPQRRLTRGHMKNAPNAKRPSPVEMWIVALIDAGLSPGFEILEQGDWDRAIRDQREINWIEYFRTVNPKRMLNFQDGGQRNTPDYSAEARWTLAERERHSELMKSYYAERRLDPEYVHPVEAALRASRAVLADPARRQETSAKISKAQKDWHETADEDAYERRYSFMNDPEWRQRQSHTLKEMYDPSTEEGRALRERVARGVSASMTPEVRDKIRRAQYEKWGTTPPEERCCPVCGAVFTPKYNPGPKTCGDNSCRGQYIWMRRRGEM